MSGIVLLVLAVIPFVEPFYVPLPNYIVKVNFDNDNSVINREYEKPLIPKHEDYYLNNNHQTRKYGYVSDDHEIDNNVIIMKKPPISSQKDSNLNITYLSKKYKYVPEEQEVNNNELIEKYAKPLNTSQNDLNLLNINTHSARKYSHVPEEHEVDNNVFITQFEKLSDLSQEDSYLNITQLARKYDYVLEEHKVTTEDGYILTLHRLSTKRRMTNGIPVFLMHGLMDSSDSWILQGPGNALGYLLADRGYDVWMGNARGNKHSLSHTAFSPNDKRFWKFSWEEIGVYDVSAMIDYVLSASAKKSLYYIGHSQGTTSYFVMNSLKPEYRAKVKMMFALSPIAWMSHAESPVLNYLSSVGNLLQYFQLYNTQSPAGNFLNQLYGAFCKVSSAGCNNIFELLFGNNYFISDAMLPIILGHLPSGSSMLQIIHYWQLYESGRFCRFDYGWMKNLQEYGQFSPPDYDLSGINVPIVLFFSGNDWLSHPTDVSVLYNSLPNVYKSYYSRLFNHIDYMYAGIAKEAVYTKIIREIENFEAHGKLPAQI